MKECKSCEDDACWPFAGGIGLPGPPVRHPPFLPYMRPSRQVAGVSGGGRRPVRPGPPLPERWRCPAASDSAPGSTPPSHGSRPRPGPDFLAVATPGAGKTTFALAALRTALARSRPEVVIVAPTAHLKVQWARPPPRAGAPPGPGLDAGRRWAAARTCTAWSRATSRSR